MQVCAVILLVAYYRSGSVRSALQGVSEAKASGGVLFVIIAGAVAGGLIPQFAKIATRMVRKPAREFWLDTLYAGFVFAVIGVQVNAFYLFQGELFGTASDAMTLAKKTAVDMFVVSPVIFLPTGIILIHARQVQFDRRQILSAFSWQFYRTRILTALPINWCFWIPILLCLYALPPNLQFPFGQLAEACWSLVFIFLAQDSATQSGNSETLED